MTVAVAKSTVLFFFAVIVQVTIVSSIGILGGSPDLVLVLLVAVSLSTGSIFGAFSGFWAGLVLDIAQLGTLGFTSLLLTLAGFWIGRYGETTGRGRPYAAPLSAFAITLLAAPANVALHFLLGQPVSAQAAFATLIPSAIVNGLLAFGLHPLLRRYLARADRLPPRPREVGLV